MAARGRRGNGPAKSLNRSTLRGGERAPVLACRLPSVRVAMYVVSVAPTILHEDTLLFTTHRSPNAALARFGALTLGVIALAACSDSTSPARTMRPVSLSVTTT